jgi:hypothetical protein
MKTPDENEPTRTQGVLSRSASVDEKRRKKKKHANEFVDEIKLLRVCPMEFSLGVTIRL